MVTDLFDRAPPFQYVVGTTANIPHAFSSLTSIEQRFILLTVTKCPSGKLLIPENHL